MNSLGPPESPHRYGVGPLVGAGAEGVVYRGTRRDSSPRIEVSIKFIRSTDHTTVGDLERRLAEVELTRSISSPGLVTIIEGFIHQSDEGAPSLVLVSPWVEGRSLDSVAPELTVEQIIRTLGPVASALDSMHGGSHAVRQTVVHLDVKPSNIIVTSAGGGRLIDFGLSRLAGPGVPGLGTRGFQAPSVATGEYDAGSDRYSFAVTVASALKACRSRSGERIANRIDPTAVADSTSSLADWLVSVPQLTPTRWPAVTGGALLGLAALAGVAAGVSTVGGGCGAETFADRAVSAGLDWHDPDGDCLHSAYELLVTETAADAGNPIGEVPSAVEQIEAIPAHLTGCEPAAWSELAIELASGEPLRQSWSDRDSDCLHDAYEINAIGTDPLSPDTDGDGVTDTFDHGTVGLLHDPLTQLRHIDRLADLATRLDVVDAVRCDPVFVAAAAAAWFAAEQLEDEWLDSDGDCLRDRFETDVLGSDPTSADTDGDGWPDGTDPDLSSGLIEPIDTQIEGNAWRQETREERLDTGAQPRAPGD